MSGWLIVLMGLLNLAAAVDLARRGQWPMAVTFGSYGVACAGLYFAQR